MTQDEKRLLLSVARLLAVHLSDHINSDYTHIRTDLKDLREALKPFNSNIAAINQDKSNG